VVHKIFLDPALQHRVLLCDVGFRVKLASLVSHKLTASRSQTHQGSLHRNDPYRKDEELLDSHAIVNKILSGAIQICVEKSRG
jgi:hypothetical protein